MRPNNQLEQYLLPKQPVQNEVFYNFQTQNDEYTRNLVPPPYIKYEDKDKQNIKQFYKPKEEIIKEVAKVTELQTPPIQESIVIALNPPAEFQKQKHQQQQHTQLQQQQQHTQLPQHEQNQQKYYQQQNIYSLQHFPVNKEPAIDVQVTKEKFNHFQNTVPQHYNPHPVPQFTSFGNFFTVQKPSERPNQPTYEVTEGKFWQHTPQFVPVLSTRIPDFQEANPSDVEKIKPFLPTPYNPDDAAPTSPTQSEVSEIYSYMKNKQKEAFFNIKEVSTHYPIVGTPNFVDYEQNELTTPQSEHETTVRVITRQRIRPHRRRRPINRTTTEETITATDDTFELKKSQPPDTFEEPVRQRPLRRRPIRYKTTEIPIETTTPRMKYRIRTRPQSHTQIPTNHKMNSDLQIPNEDTYSNRKPAKNIYQDEKISLSGEDYNNSGSMETMEERPNREPVIHVEQEPEVSENVHTPYITTEPASTTRISEIEFETSNPIDQIQNTIIIQEIQDEKIPETTITTTIPTTTTSATTTTEVPKTTQKPTRRRPINYSANRPRFSVKDYRQRLNQYTSTTTTTEANRILTENPRKRLRKPTRRPIQLEEEEETELSRSRFKPKDPRFRPHNFKQSEDSDEETITDKQINKINTRLRPFGRYRSTTESSSTTARVSIKPNLFSVRRRPKPISLRNRIANKQEVEESTLPEENIELKKIDTTTQEVVIERMDTTTPFNDIDAAVTELDLTDIIRNESMMYSQRVSDLTSSAQKEYETPGLFKNVSPTSRRIPSYFTIATDDPILPIEAFFPNLKDKDKET